VVHFKRRFSIILCVITVLLSIMIQSRIKVFAATAYVSVGSATGEVGSEVSIVVTVSADETMGAHQIQLVYDSSMIEYVSGFETGGNGIGAWLIYDEGASFSRTIRFKILKAGTSEISVGAGTEVSKSMYASSTGLMSLSTSSGSITGTAPVNYSTNNNLSSLSISPGVLSPAFSPSTTTYTTSVGKDVTRLNISAVAEDSKATISVSGAALDPGSNTTTITVTAENGSKKVYTIYTTVATDKEPETEAPTTADFKDIEVAVDKVKYVLKSDFSEHPLPVGYTETDYDYEGKKIKTGVGVNTKLTLVYLETSDKTGESGFYIYDSVSKTFTKYIEVAEPSITYCILTITDKMEKPDGYTLMDYNLNGKKVKAMMNEDRTYLLFYGISSQGVTGWFRYCIADSTIQVFDGSQDGVAFTPIAVEEEKKEESSSIDFKKWLILGAGASAIIIVILIAIIIALAGKLSQNKKAFKKAMHNLDEEPFMSARDFADIYEEESRDDEKLFDDYEDDEDEDFDLEKTEVEEIQLMDIDDK